MQYVLLLYPDEFLARSPTKTRHMVATMAGHGVRRRSA